MGAKLVIKHKGMSDIVDIGAGFWCRTNERDPPTLCADSHDGKSQFDIQLTLAHIDRLIEQLKKLKEKMKT